MRKLLFLGLNFREALFIELYLDVIGIIIQKKNMIVITNKNF